MISAIIKWYIPRKIICFILLPISRASCPVSPKFISKSGKFRFSIIIWTWQDLAIYSNILAFQMSMKLLQYYDPIMYLLVLSYNSLKFSMSEAYNITTILYCYILLDLAKSK